MPYYTAQELRNLFGPGFESYVDTDIPIGSYAKPGIGIFTPQNRILLPTINKKTPGATPLPPGIPGVPGVPQIPKPGGGWLDKIIKGIDSFIDGYNQGRGNLPPGVYPPLPGGGGVPGPGPRQQPQGGISLTLLLLIAGGAYFVMKKK